VIRAHTGIRRPREEEKRKKRKKTNADVKAKGSYEQAALAPRRPSVSMRK
jgi:hypothetical protein